jgi:hypothetical protein
MIESSADPYHAAIAIFDSRKCLPLTVAANREGHVRERSIGAAHLLLAMPGYRYTRAERAT